MLKENQTGLDRELLWMFVERIVDEVFPGETGAARLQQVGLFTLIYLMQRDPPVTAARIAALMKQSQSQIHRQLKKLIALGLIERTKILNKQGRGQAMHLSIRHTKETRQLLRAIGKAPARAK